MNPIVAASTETARRALVALTQDASFKVRSVAENPTALARLLQHRDDAWVVTGGTLTLVRPFLESARTASAAAVAVLSGPTDSEARAELGYGRLAVIRAVPQVATFRAASIASREGLSVWDPDLDLRVEPDPAIAAPLSPRERTVLELTGAGLSTKAVARELGISPNTVKFHLHAVFEKLGVTSRAEAVMAAIRRGELAV
jgi:DNA-binding NarL/FixJ family response regulator